MIESFYSSRLRHFFYVETEEGWIKEAGFSRSSRGKETGSALIEDLKKYLNRKEISFSRYQVDLSGHTSFEKFVLLEARKIPYGKTISYSELAGTKAARAVGNALARNPIPVIIPCHRVLRKNHELGGYSAGVGIKKKLLEIEGIRL